MPLAGLENTTGSKIYVSAAEPATITIAGFQALDWEEVVGVVTFGEWGDSENDVTEPTLSEGRVFHTNGVRDGGEVSISVQHRATDAGADIVKANAGGQDVISFLKVYASGEGEFAAGILTSPKFREAGSDTVRGFTTMARINTVVLEATAVEVTAALAP